MSYPTPSDPGFSNASDRLKWVVEGGWDPTGSGIKIGQSQAFTGLFTDDLAKTSGNELSRIYESYIEFDLQRLANLYVDYKYGNPTSDQEVIAFKYKGDIIKGYFENQKTKILNVMKPRQRNLGSTNYLAGAQHQNKLTNLYLQDPNFGNMSVIKGLALILTTIDTAGSVNPANEDVIEYILDAFGLQEHLDSLGIPDVSSQGGAEGLEQLNAAGQDQLDALKNALRATLGKPPIQALTNEEKRLVNQCALITDLLHGQYSKLYYPTTWAKGPDNDNKAFNGRIYPVRTDRFNPDNLINMCTMPRNIQDTLNDTTDANKNNTLVWDIYWVFKDSKGINEQLVIPSSDNAMYTNTLSALQAKNVINVKDASTILTNVGQDWNKYSINKAEIKFDGTNPSTARNDVKVNLTINLGSIAAINTVCAYLALNSSPSTTTTSATTAGTSASTPIAELVELKIYDLIAAPVTSTFESREVGPTNGTASKREFKPDYSRIRLKARPGTGSSASDLIIDLATVGHTISRSDDGKCVLTINYRGYFEQSLSMPFNDALTDSTIIQNRIGRAQKVIDAKKEKCSDKILREITRVNSEEDRLEVEDFHNNGGLVKRLFDNKLLYKYEIDKNLYDLGINGDILDPRLNYVKSVSSSDNPSSLLPARRPSAQSADAYYGDSDSTKSRNAQSIADANKAIKNINVDILGSANLFFWLGDLMEILLDCLYKDDTPTMFQHSENLNMRFVVGTIRVPDPKDLTNSIIINPLQIPIDLGFFSAWYHDTIVKKGVKSYPIGIFIKDLVERLVNDVIYDTCFSILLPDESPPVLRSTFFTDHDKRWFRTYNSSGVSFGRKNDPGTWFDPLDPYDPNYTRASSRKPNILMKKNATASIKDAKNYCVLYQQFPSYFRQLKYSKNGNLKDDPYCPTIWHGNNMDKANFVTSPSFTQQGDGSYLKEARFFNSQNGNLNLLSNVYDLSFKIETINVYPIFYPGNIINFVLTDFNGGGKNKYSILPIPTDGTHADPHTKGTLANTLGFGGYHIIKSVTYNLEKEANNVNASISIDTKFIGTDAKGDGDRDSTSKPFANEPKICIEIYNDAVDAMRQTEIDTGVEAADIEKIYSAGSGGAGTSVGDETTTSRETEVLSGVLSTPPAAILTPATNTATTNALTPSYAKAAKARVGKQSFASAFFEQKGLTGNVDIISRTKSGNTITIRYKYDPDDGTTAQEFTKTINKPPN